MLRVSTKARYALRAMIELALHEGQGPLQLHEVAKAQEVSGKYLEQLAIPLRHAGLLLTERGPRGGYELARAADNITALDIVQAVEGPLSVIHCVDRPAACHRSPTCAARRLWQRMGAAIADVLAHTTLADLREAQQSLSAPQAMACYQI